MSPPPDPTPDEVFDEWVAQHRDWPAPDASPEAWRAWRKKYRRAAAYRIAGDDNYPPMRPPPEPGPTPREWGTAPGDR